MLKDEEEIHIIADEKDKAVADDMLGELEALMNNPIADKK